MAVMQDWYKVELPLKECGLGGKADQLQKAFEVMFLTRYSPMDAALFELHDDKLESNTFYFSPAAFALVSVLIERFGGQVCDPPSLSDRLVLLVGHPGAREALLQSGNSRSFLGPHVT